MCFYTILRHNHKQINFLLRKWQRDVKKLSRKEHGSSGIASVLSLSERIKLGPRSEKDNRPISARKGLNLNPLILAAIPTSFP